MSTFERSLRNAPSSVVPSAIERIAVPVLRRALTQYCRWMCSRSLGDEIRSLQNACDAEQPKVFIEAFFEVWSEVRLTWLALSSRI